MSHKAVKTFGIVSLAIFNQDFIVTAGMTQKEIIDEWKNLKLTKEVREALNDFKKTDLFLGSSDARFWFHGSHGAIMLDRYDGSWHDLDILLHECVHAVRWLAERSHFDDEEELIAYTTVQLFRSCRRLLDGSESESDFERII